jgi:hypothetical protein
MDKTLHDKLTGWHKQIETLRPLELQYLQLEGQEKALLARLTIAADGRSHAEREAKALASEDWAKFQHGLAVAKAQYLDARRILDLKVKAYEAEYLTFKVEAEAIKRSA